MYFAGGCWFGCLLLFVVCCMHCGCFVGFVLFVNCLWLVGFDWLVVDCLIGGGLIRGLVVYCFLILFGVVRVSLVW